MKINRAAIFLGLGVLLALLAGILVFVVTQQAAAPKQAVVETISVVVAKSDIPERTILTPQLLDTREYPKNLVPSGAITSVDVAARQTTLAKIPAGAPILAGQVAAGGGATGLSLTLEKGKVYVAFPVGDPLGAAGLIRPGDHIDILGTVPPATVPTPGLPGLPAGLLAGATPAAGAAAGSPITQTIVQNLEVIDVVGKNVLTFIVDHQTALVLKNVRDTGVIVDIVLRSRAESDSIQTTSVDSGYIVKTYGFTK